MHLISVSILFRVIEMLITAYWLSSGVFLLVWIFNKKARSRTPVYLDKSNRIILFVLVINLIWTAKAALECYFASTPSTTQNELGITGANCFTGFIRTFFLAFLFHSLFIWKRFRTQIPLTIVSLLLLLVYSNYGRIYVLFSPYRDYLPMDWSISWDTSILYGSIVVAALYFAICWFDFKKQQEAV